MHTVYGVAECITVLDVQKARLRVLFTLRLVSGTTIFKSAGCKGIPFVAAHKLILNVSKIRLRLICARALYPVPLFSKALAVRGFFALLRTN